MLKWLIRRRLAAFEREHGYDTEYMREVLDRDLGAFLRFAKLNGISGYRKDVPLAVYYATKLTTVMAEDCGPCTQLVVGMALHDGLACQIIASIIGGAEEEMTEEVRLGVRFARAAMAHDPAADALREEVARRWGPRAVVSSAMAMVAARAFPTFKYALGYGKACRRVIVAGEPVTPRRLASAARAAS